MRSLPTRFELSPNKNILSLLPHDYHGTHGRKQKDRLRRLFGKPYGVSVRHVLCALEQ